MFDFIDGLNHSFDDVKDDVNPIHIAVAGVVLFIALPGLIYLCSCDTTKARIDSAREAMIAYENEKSCDLGNYYVIKSLSPGYLVVDKTTNNVFYREVHYDSYHKACNVTITPYMYGNSYLMYSIDESKYYIINDDIKVYVDYN